MLGQIRFIFLALLAFVCGNCLAYSSIATVEGHAPNAVYRSNNYESQKEADEVALEGCRVAVRKIGIGHLAKKCKVVTRGKGPGYGAMTCGDDGCSWATGYDSTQYAVDAAYENCSKQFTNCKDKNIQFWEDFAGFPGNKSKKLSKTETDCRPRTSALRCQSSCTNGDCIVSYSNGCRLRVQVSPQFNGTQWIYPPPSC